MSQCKYQFLWSWGLGVFFWLFIISSAPVQARIWPTLLTFTAVFGKPHHLFQLLCRRRSTRCKVVIKAVSFMMGRRIIISYVQLLNSSWTFGLAVRKRLETKTPDLNPLLFPHLFSQPLAWTLCTAQLSLPIWIFAATGGWIRHRNPTPPSSGRGWNWIPAGGRCSWRWITSLRRSSLHPDSS